MFSRYDGESAAVMTTKRSGAPGTAPPVVRRQPWLDRLVTLADDQFTIPGTNVRVGLDAIVGFLLPQLGDGITGVLSGVVLWVAWREGAPPILLARMAGNVAVDVATGMVPIVGDLFDVTYRANRRNHTLLREFQRARYGTHVDFDETTPAPSASPGASPSWLVGAVLVTVLLTLLLLPIGLLFLVGHWLLG